MTKQVVRNAKGLVDALFDNIDAINAKTIDAEQARAVSHSARTIVSIATLELDYKKLVKDSSPTIDGLKSLVIEGPTPAAA